MVENTWCTNTANRQKSDHIAFCTYIRIDLGVSTAFELEFCLLSDDPGVLLVVCALSWLRELPNLMQVSLDKKELRDS